MKANTSWCYMSAPQDSMNGTDPKLVLSVRSVRSHQTQDVGQTASNVGFDASIFVQQEGRVSQLLRDGRYRLSLDFILFECCQFLVQGLPIADSNGPAESNKREIHLDFLVQLDGILFPTQS
jgi:hypothetical protein